MAPALRRPRRRTGSARAAPRRGSAAPRGQDAACRRTRFRPRRSAPRAAALKPVDAVLADADDGQPARRCGSLARDRVRQRHATHPHSRRHRRRRGCWRSGWPAAPISTVTLSLAGRTAAPARAAGAGAHRRLRRRRGPRGLSGRRAHRRADRRHASLCQRRSRPMRRGRARSRRAAAWRCGGRRGPRSPATAGSRSSDARRRGARARGRRRAASSSRSAARSWRRSRQAPQHHYLIRSVDPVDPPLPLPHVTYVTGRGPFSEADERALHDRRTASMSSSPRTAAAARPTARSRRRARSASRSIMLRRPPAARGARRRDRRRC